MRKFLQAASLTLLSLFTLSLVSVPAFAAFDPLYDTCAPGDVQDSTVCQERVTAGDPVDATNGIIPKVANIIAAVGGIIAVIFIMINGVTILTSTGDPAKVNKARDGIIYASVGIAVIVLARVIVAIIMRFL